MPVESVMDRWEIDDEWWRGESITRMYYQLVVDNGRVVIVYRDLNGAWHSQDARWIESGKPAFLRVNRGGILIWPVVAAG